MEYILFDDLTDELPLVTSGEAPYGFKVFTDYAYDPGTGTKSGNSVTEYWVSFLCPTTAIFSQVSQRLLAQRNAYFTSETLEYIPCTINSAFGQGAYNGVYNIWFLLDNEWFTQIGDTWEVRLRGYGEPPITHKIKPGQVFSVSESAPIGTIIGTVEGFDQTLVYQGRPDIPIAYSPATGVLSVGSALDYEETDSYTLEIGSETVTVYILDEAEAPIPERSSYTFYINADSPMGTQVGTVSAEIQGRSGLLPSYSIISGNTGAFTIDPSTGEIVLIDITKATDNQVLGISYLGSNPPITCTIRIIPRDSGIKFNPYRFSLNATPVVNQVVGVINEAEVTLELVHEAYQMSGSNLIVATPEAISPGITELSITARTTSGQEGSIPVFITIPDLADPYGDQEFWIAEDASNGSTVGTVDFGVDDPSLVFSLDPVGIFDINTKTGDIILVRSSLLQVGSYTLSASAGVAYSKAIVIRVYAVVAESDVNFTVPPSATVGLQVGVVPGVYPLTLTSGSLGVYALDLATGVITVGAVSVTSASFVLTDANSDTISVQIEVSDNSAEGGDTFLGGVYPGQTGQSLLAITGIQFAIQEVGFGDGSVTISPDNIGTVSRNIGQAIIFDKPTNIKHELAYTCNVNTAMISKLSEYFSNSTELTCSVPGADFQGIMTGLRRSYGGDTPSAQITVKEI